MEPSIATINVFVLSDVRFYREGLAEVLDTTGQITVLGTAAATEQGLRLAAEMDPDVVLLDTAMVDGRGGATTVQARAAHEDRRPRGTRVGGRADPAGRGGSPRLCHPRGILGEVVTAIVSVVHEQMVGSPKLRTLLIKGPRARRRLAPARRRVIDREERQILDLIAQGLTNKRIAHELQIEQATVKNHVHNILHKLGLRPVPQPSPRYVAPCIACL